MNALRSTLLLLGSGAGLVGGCGGSAVQADEAHAISFVDVGARAGLDVVVVSGDPRRRG